MSDRFETPGPRYNYEQTTKLSRYPKYSENLIRALENPLNTRKVNMLNLIKKLCPNSRQNFGKF